MIEALKFACEKKEIYPQIGVTVFRIWIIILAFVGIQLAWNLRPFLCNKNEEFKLFRKYEGNFYTAIVYSIKQLVSPEVYNYTEENRSHLNNQDTENPANEDSTILNLLRK